ncbi:MAG: DUF4129 domain-containing protein [Thermomicrobiaceae bacterium]
MANHQLRDRISALVLPVRELPAQQTVLMLLLILAETSIVYLFAGTLLATHGPPYTPISPAMILLVLLITWVIPHLLATMRIWTPEYESVMTLSIFSTMLLVIKTGAFPNSPWLSLDWLKGSVDALSFQENESIRSIWMLTAFVVYAWWRGRTRAEAGLETAYTMLRFGLIFLAGALIFTTLVMPPGAGIFGRMDAALIGFLSFTLLAIAIARQPHTIGSQSRSGTWVWAIILVAPLLAIGAVTLFSVEIMTRETLDLLLRALSPIFWATQLALQALVLTIAVIIFILASPIIWFVGRQGFSLPGNFPTIDLSPGNAADAEDFARSTLQIENPVRYLIVGVLLLGLIWALSRFAFRRRRRWQEFARQQRDSLIEWDDAPDGVLKRARRWLVARLNRSGAHIGPDGPEWESTRQIRRSYGEFLRIARQHHLARTRGETPVTFATRIKGSLPGANTQVDAMTSAYNRARYSGQPASPEDAEITRKELASFRDTLQEH